MVRVEQSELWRDLAFLNVLLYFIQFFEKPIQTGLMPAEV
jgi:hypothetical protein